MREPSSCKLTIITATSLLHPCDGDAVFCSLRSCILVLQDLRHRTYSRNLSAAVGGRVRAACWLAASGDES